MVQFQPLKDEFNKVLTGFGDSLRNILARISNEELANDAILEPQPEDSLPESLITQYRSIAICLGEAVPPLSDEERMALEEIERRFKLRIKDWREKLSSAFQSYEIILVEDDDFCRMETKLGLARFVDRATGKSAADRIIGEYRDAATVINGPLSNLDKDKNYLLLLDGSFPCDPHSKPNRPDTYRLVLDAVTKDRPTNLFTIVRSSFGVKEEFRRVAFQYPTVIGVFGKGADSFFFQGALAADEKVMAEICLQAAFKRRNRSLD